MPCDSGPIYYDNCGDYRKELDRLTQNLCYLCGELAEDSALEAYASQRILDWWAEHQAIDKARVDTAMRDAMLAITHRLSEKDVDAVARERLEEAQKVHPVSRFHKRWFVSRARAAMQAVQAEREAVTAKERARKAALDKLSAEERQALGLL